MLAKDLNNEPVNFERYEAQIEKIDKMGGLCDFVTASIEQEFRQTARDVQDQKHVIGLYDKLAVAMQTNAEKMSIRNKNSGTQFTGMMKENEDIETKMSTVQAEHDALKEKLPSLQKPLEDYQKELEKVLQGMNQKVLTKCHEYLQKMTEDHLCYVLEHLIGAMIGRESADPYTVEMYIRKFEGFYMTFQKIDYSKLNSQALKDTLEEL